MANITGIDIGPSGVGISTGGGTSSKKARKLLRDQYRVALGYQPGLSHATAKSQVMGTIRGYRDAGMHPLFAGGGAAGGIGPAASVGVPDTGQRFSVSRKMIRPEEAALTEAQTELIKAQTDEIKARAAQSMMQVGQAARTASPGAKAIPLKYEEARQTLPLPGKPGQVPGDHPAWTKHNLSFGGYKMSLWAPAQETSEIFESMAMWPLIYSANQNAIHKWAGQVMKDKSNIGKLSGFFKFIADWAGEKI